MNSSAPRTAHGHARGLPPHTAAAGRPQIELISPAASPEEAAAIVAALERFMRATAPPEQRPADAPEGWRRAAMLEGVMREDDWDGPHPWINT